jgi:hypothetical protein
MPEPADGRSIDIPVHQFWWLHDARWYQGVKKRFGQEVANEINAETMLFVARRIARWYAHVHGLDFAAMSMDEFVKWFKEIPRIMWTEEMTNPVHTATGEHEFETVVTEHFVIKMLKAARSLESYQCPCLEMRAGFFAGMGLEVDDSRLDCLASGGQACQFRAVVRRGGTTAS